MKHTKVTQERSALVLTRRHTRLISLVCASALALGVPILSTPVTQAADTGSISGTITLPVGHSFENTGAPAVGQVRACLFVAKMYGPDPKAASSTACKYGNVNSDGTYTINGLTLGEEYAVYAQPNRIPVIPADVMMTAYDGYATPWSGLSDFNYQDTVKPDPVLVPLDGTPVTGIDIAMQQGAKITGTVSPADADAKSVSVCEISGSEFISCENWWTEPDGTYTAIARPGATVVLYAQAAGYISQYLGGLEGPYYDDEVPFNDYVTRIIVPEATYTVGGNDFALTKQTIISGTVFGVTSIADVEICVVAVDGNWYCRLGALNKTTGDYSFAVRGNTQFTVCASYNRLEWRCLDYFVINRDSFPYQPLATDMSSVDVTKYDAPGSDQTAGGYDFYPKPWEAGFKSLVVTGNPVVGQTLTAVATTGPSDANLTYQWYTNCNLVAAEITGATGPTYVVQSADVDQSLCVKVTASKLPWFTEKSLTSLPVTGQAAELTLSSYSWTVPSEAAASETITVTSTSDWQATASDSWITINPASGIDGSSSQTISVDANPSVDARSSTIVFTSNDGLTATYTITQPGVPVVPTLLSAMVISGEAMVGRTLSVSASVTPSDATVTYEWYTGCDGTPTAISGATSDSYLVQASDAGQSICAKATASKLPFYSKISIFSTPVTIQVPIEVTKAVAAPNPVAVFQNVTIDLAYTPSDASYTVAWYRNGLELISGATALSYTVAPADSGSTLVAKITVSKAGYDSVEVFSNTITVTGDKPPTGLVWLTPAGIVRVGTQVDLHWGIMPQNAFILAEWYVGGVLVMISTNPYEDDYYIPTAADLGKDIVVKLTVYVPSFYPLELHSNVVRVGEFAPVAFTTRAYTDFEKEYIDLIFDASSYAAANPDVVAAVGNSREALLNHFITYSPTELNRLSSFSLVFDPVYYMYVNSDIEAYFGTGNYFEAFTHFLNWGMDEWRATHPGWDVRTYRDNYPDLYAAFGDNCRDYFRHYLPWGFSEGRSGLPL